MHQTHLGGHHGRGGGTLTDGTAMQLTLTVLEKAGVYDHPIKTWLGETSLKVNAFGPILAPTSNMGKRNASDS
jgi:hypothetical protein